MANMMDVLRMARQQNSDKQQALFNHQIRLLMGDQEAARRHKLAQEMTHHQSLSGMPKQPMDILGGVQGILADMSPGYGDYLAIRRGGAAMEQAYDQAKQGNWMNAAGKGAESLAEYISTVPGIGDLAAMTKGAASIAPGLLAMTRQSDLPMDLASRMQRARDMGFDTDRVWYHGTTHDFDAFGGKTHNPEGYLGGGHYATSSAQDVSDNYAGLGPDLTQRIEIMAERFEDDLGSMDAARKHAIKSLKGSNEGVVMPLVARGKTANISSYDPTFLRMERDISPDDFMDDAAKEIKRADYDDVTDYKVALEEKAYELAEDASFGVEPEGELADFITALRDLSYEYEDMDVDKIIEDLSDYLYDGGIPADKLNKILRESEGLIYAMDDNGELASGDIIRKAFEAAGFDNIVMDASDAFPNMNIEPGTEHIIINSPKNIRSIFAKFDPAKTESSNVLAGTLAGALGLGAIYRANKDDKPVK